MIKKIFVAVAVFSTVIVNAQLGNKGQHIGSATINLNSSKQSYSLPSNSSNTNTGINTSVAFGTFSKKNSLQKIGIQLGAYNSKSPNSYITESNNKAIGLFYNIVKLHSFLNVLYYGLIQQPTLNYGVVKQINNGIIYNKSTTTNTTASYSLIPTIYFKLNKKWAINLNANNMLSINYENTKTEFQNSSTNSNSKTNSFNLQAGFWQQPLNNLNIGLNYLW